MKLSSTDANRYSFSFGVADFSLLISCNHLQLTNTLAKRYSDFPSKHPPKFQAHIDWVGLERHSPLLDTNTKFQNNLSIFGLTEVIHKSSIICQTGCRKEISSFQDSNLHIRAHGLSCKRVSIQVTAVSDFLK